MQGSYNSNWNVRFGAPATLPVDRMASQQERSDPHSWWGMDSMVLPVDEGNNSSGVARQEVKVLNEGQDLPTNEEKHESTNVGTESSPQDDDDKGLVHQIAYALSVEGIKERLSDKLPNQSLELSEKALFVRDNFHIIHVLDFRRYILGSHDFDLRDELKFARSLSKVKRGGLWYHRLWIVEKLGADYVLEEFKLAKESLSTDAYDASLWYHLVFLALKLGTYGIDDAFEFMNDISRVDGKNTFAWRRRCTLLETLGVDDKRASEEFGFLQEILKADARRYDAWYHRWWLIEKFGINICADNEFEFTESMIDLDEENDYAWSYRRWLAKKLEIKAVIGDLSFTRKILSVIAMGELSFTRKILSVNVKNAYAWYHRKWVFKAFSVLDSCEPGFCEVLSGAIYNDSAWNQRLIAVTNFLESSADAKKLGVRSSFEEAFLLNPERYKLHIRAAKVNYSLSAISSSPGNEYPWRYLRSLYRKSEFDVDMFEDICLNVLLVKADSDLDLQIGVIRKRRHYVNALDTILELICRGYQPSYKMGDLITHLCKGAKQIVSVDYSISAFFNGISLFLQYVDPMRANYWQWRTGVALKEVYEFYDDGGGNRIASIESNDADLDSRRRKQEEGQGLSTIEEKFESNRSYGFLTKSNPVQVFQKKSFWRRKHEEGQGLSTIDEKFERNRSHRCLGKSNPVQVVQKKSFSSMPQRRIMMERQALDKKPEIPCDQRIKKTDATHVPGGDSKKLLIQIGSLPVDCLNFPSRETVRSNAECSWVWEPWRHKVETLNLDFNEELSFLGELAKNNTCNAYIWFSRRWVAEKLGASCARKELEFTEEILLADAKNEYAWSHRQWVFRTFGGWEDEIAFCHEILANDRSNGSAWNQRLLVTSHVCHSTEEEVDYAINCTMEQPENEYPWLYLGALHKVSKVDRKKLNGFFERLFKKESTMTEDCLKGLRMVAEEVKDFFLDKINDLELNSIKNRRMYVNSLDTLLDLMCHGHATNGNVKKLLRHRYPSRSGDCVESIHSILQSADPLRGRYWTWHINHVTAHIRRCCG